MRSGEVRSTRRSGSVRFVFGLVMVQVDNWAHLGGFAGGYGLARWLDPLKPERGDHTLIALALLVVSLLSILASIVFGLPMID